LCRTSMHNQSGFTLLELLLYVSIIGTLLGALALFFGMTAEVRLRNQAVSEVTQQGQAAMETIASSVRNATAITTPATGASGSTLTVTVPTASLSPTIVASDGTTLTIKEGSGTAIALTNSKVRVTTISIKNLSRSASKGTVQISFTLARVNPSNRPELDYNRTFTTTIGLRP
jgi:type II secretory pathway pseudopilin PulG